MSKHDQDIIVSVVRYGDRKNLLLSYTDPRTGKRIKRTAGTTNRRQAERAAAKWEEELREGSYHRPTHATWDEFRERYERQVLQEQAEKTLDKVISVFNAVEQIASPRRLADLDDQRLIYFKDELLRSRSISTAASYLAHLRSALSSAVEWGMLPRLPKVPKVKRTKGVKLMRGRAVTPAEFDQMLVVTPQVVGAAAAPSWQFLLQGLWTSGLRLSEACQLYWDGYRGHTVELTGHRPMFMIRGELEKGRRDRRLPMAPEFAQLLATVAADGRTGRVFEPSAKRVGAPTLQLHRIGELVADIGKLAGVVVDADPRTGKPTKFASAHDLRRAFGYRWAKRVMPAVLQKLMRHASIQTTMQYYVDLEAEDVADVLWAAAGNTFGNSGPNEGVSD